MTTYRPWTTAETLAHQQATGHLLREARYNLDHGAGAPSLTRVCTLLPVGSGALSKWEHGKSSPTVETLVTLAAIYGRTVASLIPPGPRKQWWDMVRDSDGGEVAA